MKSVVLSGINLTSGGPLSIYKDCLKSFSKFSQEYEVIALVNNKEEFLDYEKDITIIEYPKSKTSWLLRIYYEYFYFYKLSKKIKPQLWFSLHDMSPYVKAESQVVYCHNASQFYKMNLKEVILDKKFYLFNLFYKYLYRININSNKHVIVQQDWIRKEFEKAYNLRDVIVAHPILEDEKIELKEMEKHTFIYPTYPRIFKNVELICEAARILNDEKYQFLITIDGTENAYAKHVVKKYSNIPSVKFIGLKSREEVFDYYSRVEGMIFPSKLETWGLPLSEFRKTNKKIFASDFKFCRETLSDYKNVEYFNSSNPEKLAELIKKHDYMSIKNESELIKFTNIPSSEELFFNDWDNLTSFLLNNSKRRKTDEKDSY